MAREVETLVKLRGVNPADAQESIVERYRDIFGKAVPKRVSDRELRVKGGAFWIPYGFKAKIKTETLPDGGLLLKTSARPAMNVMALLLILLMSAFLIVGMNFGARGLWGLIAGVMMGIGALAARKSISSKLIQASEDIRTRFS